MGHSSTSTTTTNDNGVNKNTTSNKTDDNTNNNRNGNEDRKTEIFSRDSRKIIPQLFVGGLGFPFYFDSEKVKETIDFASRERDIFIVTYPKCGTTWMRYIVWSIQNDGKTPLPSMDELSYDIAPYLERAGTKSADLLPSPRTLNVHTTYELTAQHPKARYIYVARDPRDTCVSYYHFIKDGVGGADWTNGTFDEFFEEFVRGEVPYGDYFDHVKGFWDRRKDDNMLFLTYEEMQADPRGVILTVARFISDEENDYHKKLSQDDDLLNRILHNTSFSYMKKSIPVVIKRASDNSCGDSALDEGVLVDFFRKGIIGDWVNYFSSPQLKRLKERMEERIGGTGIEGLWDF